ncbi:MAG: NADH-quinone oxidoreductase subunit I [Alphaproteobacteria bacterium]|nr:NADH-quinone oxidoreductase subunit I [Alphaproteobacteria bacterium]MCB9796374.1 NADH-quinone oxidoreductase subunit I [Alphaproteobacteria bacterium]
MAKSLSTRTLSTAESVYLVEVAKGMALTMGHVVKNIWNQVTGEEFDNVEYPEVRKPVNDRYKGAHRLTTRPDGKYKCVACMCCSTACPAKCISIVAGEDPEDPIEKFPVVFNIDMLRCIYCGFCVEACPKDAIRMDTRIYEINAYTRQDMVHTRNYMRDLMDGEKPEAERWYRQHPDDAPAGFVGSIEPIVPHP